MGGALQREERGSHGNTDVLPEAGASGGAPPVHGLGQPAFLRNGWLRDSRRVGLLALLGLMATTTVPALSHAGCPYMSVSIDGPSERFELKVEVTG